MANEGTGSLLQSIITKAEKGDSVVKVRYSTVLCTGSQKAGKTTFCNLLMNTNTESVDDDDPHSVFIKTQNVTSWRKINSHQLESIISQLDKKCHAKETKCPVVINPGEILDVLILVDMNILPSTVSLLWPSTVTFITHGLLGQESFPKLYKFIKELISNSCFEREPNFDELKDSDQIEGAFYTAFVGTTVKNSSKGVHNKEITEINEKLHALNKHINCTINEFPLSFWYVDTCDNYLHVVDLKCSQDKNENISKIKDRLECTISQNPVYKMPIAWMKLGFKIQLSCYSKNEFYIHYKTVLNTIWKRECLMHSEAELKLALQFYHHHGLLFYFEAVKGVCDYVFLHYCWIFKHLKEFLVECKDKERDCQAKQLLIKEGLLNSRMIKEIDFKGPGNMSFQSFVNLLKHLKLIAPVDPNKYFVPSILDPHETDIFQEYGEPNHHPLLITFSSGSLHRNVFCYLAAYLLKHTPKGWLKPYYDGEHQCTFKDLITFLIGLNDRVCIIDKTFYLEVQIFSKPDQPSDSSIHKMVFEIIKEALLDTCSQLNISYEKCNHGFLCHKCSPKLGEHMMILRDPSEKFLCCSKSNKPREMSKSHAVWLHEVCKLSIYVYTISVFSIYLHHLSRVSP